MIKNTLKHWKDRSHSEITDEEINALSESQYQEYVAWRIKVNLDLMEAEGFITKELNDEGVPVYRMKTEEELQKEVDNL
jgi:O-glycosyl hydrolase